MLILCGFMLLPFGVEAQAPITKCPPSKSFYKNDGQKKPLLKLPDLPKIKLPSLPKIELPALKKPDLSWVRIPKIKFPVLSKPQLPNLDFLKSDNKEVASLKCPK